MTARTWSETPREQALDTPGVVVYIKMNLKLYVFSTKWLAAFAHRLWLLKSDSAKDPGATKHNYDHKPIEDLDERSSSLATAISNCIVVTP